MLNDLTKKQSSKSKIQETLRETALFFQQFAKGKKIGGVYRLKET